MATLSDTAMPKSATRKRTFTHGHRQRLDRAVTQYLEDCYRAKTVARTSEFAELAKLHRSYLSRTATAILGCSLLAYFRKKQLEEAERLLLTTPLSVEEIALRAGFGTPLTLYRCFKKAYGTSPGRFRMVTK